MESDSTFRLNSSAFADGDTIPEQYTCRGEGMSPPLGISGTPDGTASLAIVMHDPDSSRGDFLHWTIWNLNVDLSALAPGTIPDDVMQGLNDFGKVGYGAPCPHAGTHRYIFSLYALDAQLNLEASASRTDIMEAIQAHLVAETRLTGRVSAE